MTKDPRTLTATEWKALLSPDEYHVLRESGTERPGTGKYLDDESDGAYHCVGCANKLYDAEHKFHSGCGWPSFFQQVEEGALTTLTDTTFGMTRTEMRCAVCDGHLGHIFNDAPHQPGGMRHCVNGTALLFVPRGDDPQAVLDAHRKK